MTVYVDPLQSSGPWPNSPRCFRDGFCHMWVDSLDELHAMARRLQMRRAWFQGDTRLPHYDLTANKRRLAIEAGAVEYSLKAYLTRRRGA